MCLTGVGRELNDISRTTKNRRGDCKKVKQIDYVGKRRPLNWRGGTKGELFDSRGEKKWVRLGTHEWIFLVITLGLPLRWTVTDCTGHPVVQPSAVMVQCTGSGKSQARSRDQSEYMLGDLWMILPHGTIILSCCFLCSEFERIQYSVSDCEGSALVAHMLVHAYQVISP